MLESDLVDLVKKIQTYQCEFQNIEVKSANKGTPKLYDTLSSFSNQENGGTIVLGLNEKDNFNICGVYDIQDLQQKVSCECKEMEPEIRPLFTATNIDGKFVLSIEVPGIDVSQRPVFYRGSGRLKGSFVRVGDADEPMSEYEIYSYEAFRRRIRDDLRPIENAKITFFKKELLDKYFNKVKADKSNLQDNISDDDLLELMGITVNSIPTLSGVLTFSKYPQAYLPQLSIIAAVIPGTKMGDLGPNNERFISSKRFKGNILDQLEGAVNFVTVNMKDKIIINDAGIREDRTEYPIKAVREAILNALIHRDYSVLTENTPIVLNMYKDRLEIINKGGLYGRISIDSLGKIHPETRNPTLTNMLELLDISENRFSGIPTIYAEMKKANLPPPIFVSRHGEFKVILKNGLQMVMDELSDDLISSLNSSERKLLNFCKTPKSRKELIEFMGFSQFYTMGKIVKGLINKGLLKMSEPNRPKSQSQKYISGV